jgi:hypothetical protein
LEPDLDKPHISFGSVHQIGPIESLAIVKRLFAEQLPQRVLLITVETADIDDDILVSACERVVSILDREIERWKQQHICNSKGDING